MINFFDWIKLREDRNEMTTVTPTKPKPTTTPRPSPSKPDPFNPRPLPIHEPKAGDDDDDYYDDDEFGMTTVTPTKPKPTTTPRPSPSKPDPFNPKPLPIHEPKAKKHHRKKKLIDELLGIKEVYERDTVPYVRNFFGSLIRGSRGGDTPLHSNPVTAMHGERLAKKHYDENRPKYDVEGFSKSDAAVMELINAIGEIERIEAPHRTRLEQAAISLVAEHTGIPENRFRAFLNRDIVDSTGARDNPYARRQRELQNRREDDEDDEIPDMGQPEGQDEEGDEGEQPRQRNQTNNLKHHIDRLTNLNLLTQGHALSTIDNLHYKIKEVLENIDPRLVPKYKKIGVGFKGIYFFTGLCQMFQNAALRQQGAVGEVDVRFENDNEGMAMPNEGGGGQRKVGIIYARGACFPILVQELVKGAMDLVTTHANENLTDKQLKVVKKHTSERFQDEPWHFMIGPPLWKEFLQFVPPQYRQGKKLMTVIMQLARHDPEFVNKSLRDALDEIHATGNTTEIQRIITELMEEIEEEEEQYEPENDED